MKLFLLAVLTLACQASLASPDGYYDPIRPGTSAEWSAAQNVLQSFSQRHEVLKVYPTRAEGSATISFQIRGFNCIATVSDVTCYVRGHLNGYEYHENKKGQLVRGSYVNAFSNNPAPSRKQCVYQDRLISYYADCP